MIESDRTFNTHFLQTKNLLLMRKKDMESNQFISVSNVIAVKENNI